jgi:hypothetical protein
MRTAFLACLLLAASVLLPSAACAQEPAKPGPEHELLKRMVGSWDATVKFGPMEGKGVMTYKMDLGGLWLASEFKGEFAGKPFEGKGFDTYDAAKKKYVSAWFDSTATNAMISEGTADKDGKVMTLMGDGPPGPDGKPSKVKSVTEIKDKDTIVSTMTMLDKDGKEQPMGTLVYKRKK